MSKYIIEIEDEPFVRKSALYGEKSMYRAKGFKSLVFDKFGLDKLTPLDKALEEAYQKGVHDGSLDVKQRVDGAYQKGFETGQHEATTIEYQQGLNDAWGTIIKIALIPYAERSEIFDGQQDILSIVQKFSPSEAIVKLREYEQQKADEIKVGDEVYANTPSGKTQPFIIIKIYDVDDLKYYTGIDADGNHVQGGLNYIKTGRYFPQVAELLKAMKSEQRDCHTCRHQVVSSIECVDCRGLGKWETKEVTG